MAFALRIGFGARVYTNQLKRVVLRESVSTDLFTSHRVAEYCSAALRDLQIAQRRALYRIGAKMSNAQRVFDDFNCRADLFGKRFVFDAHDFKVRLIHGQQQFAPARACHRFSNRGRNFAEHRIGDDDTNRRDDNICQIDRNANRVLAARAARRLGLHHSIRRDRVRAERENFECGKFLAQLRHNLRADAAPHSINHCYNHRVAIVCRARRIVKPRLDSRVIARAQCRDQSIRDERRR